VSRRTIDHARGLLKRLIATPSFSREESETAALLFDELVSAGCANVERFGNNVVAWHVAQDSSAPILLLNSHHDTVRPGDGWQTDPFVPVVDEDRIIGLGSNDAGGALVTMLETFLKLCELPSLPWTICFAATAEEEISGTGGMAYLAEHVFVNERRPALALVGEPTSMNMAIAERGLVVLDCLAKGRTGHAARNEGVNAINIAIDDIQWIRSYDFEKIGPLLGPVGMTVTQISAGTQHNVVPDKCSFVVDVRVNECYTNADVVDIVRSHLQSDVTPRSLRLRSSHIDPDHSIVRVGEQLGRTAYGSPTMSDQALLPEGIPSMKIGPGDSARSHTPNEYLRLQELENGVKGIYELVTTFLLGKQ